MKSKLAVEYHRNFSGFLLTLTTVTAFTILAAQPELRLAVPLLVGLTGVIVILLAYQLYQELGI